MMSLLGLWRRWYHSFDDFAGSQWLTCAVFTILTLLVLGFAVEVVLIALGVIYNPHMSLWRMRL